MAEPVDTMPSKEREAKGIAAAGKETGRQDSKAPAALPTQALGGTAIKPEGWDRTGWESFKYTLYDPKAGTILTRTPLSWLKITVFYCIYYSCLAGFWTACLYIFFATLPEPIAGPRWTMDDSLIGVNPGVGLRPRNADKLIDSQMFVLLNGDDNLLPSERLGEGIINADYAKRTELFLKEYDNTNMHNAAYKPFDPKAELGVCGEFPYGYVVKNKTKEERDAGLGVVAPCIFIKLNNIWDWVPEEYDPKTEQTPPPESFAKFLKSDSAKKDKKGPSVYIDCNGRYAADQEALEDGGLQYFPENRALPISYFPYKGKKRDPVTNVVTATYHSPLVAVKVNPKTRGQMVHIECRAYYKGVKQITKTKEGLVQFEVHIKNEF